MSGLYTAWRIASDYRSSPLLSQWAAQNPDGKLRIAIYESSPRVGGRIDSRIIADMQHVPAELGGMRFTTSHKIVSLLVSQFGLPTEPFPMSKDRQYYLRGTHIDEDGMKTGLPVPYALAQDERNMTPDDLTNWVIEKVCGNGAPKWSDANWQWAKENLGFSDPVYGELPLYDVGFWNLLYAKLSNEGYDYVWDGGGYNSNTINWNGAEAMPYMVTDFSEPTDFLRITTGFHKLATSLEQKIKALGVSLYLNTRLIRFDAMEELTAGRVAENGNERTFKTRALVLALPQRSLQLLDQTGPFFTLPAVQWAIESVLPQPSYKIFLAYAERWWDKSKFYPGPTITDLPLRMTYDFGSEEERGGQPGDKRTLLLASYSDMQADTFWSVLERRNIWTNPPSWSRIASHGGAPAPETMQHMVEDMLCKSLHLPGTAPPKPTERIGAYYQDWSQDPFGAGYHAWAPHYKAWEVMRRIRRPVRDRFVTICGEAYSNAQGWVEGAFCTAESVLEEFYQLPRLAGLPASYPLLTPTPVKPGTPEEHPTYRKRHGPKHVF
jgi:monoamine oxidase